MANEIIPKDEIKADLEKIVEEHEWTFLKSKNKSPKVKRTQEYTLKFFKSIIHHLS